MSGSGENRPWQGHANPLEALHDWMKGEIARLEAELAKVVAPRSEKVTPVAGPTIAAPAKS